MFSPNRLAAFPAKESDGQERRRGPGTNGPPGIGPLGPRPPVACRLGTHSRNESVICIMSGPGTVTAPSRGSIEQYSNPHRCIESATIKMDAPSRRYADIGNSSVPSLASTSSERHSAAGRRLAKSKQTRDLQSRNKPATCKVEINPRPDRPSTRHRSFNVALLDMRHTFAPALTFYHTNLRRLHFVEGCRPGAALHEPPARMARRHSSERATAKGVCPPCCVRVTESEQERAG